MADFKTALDKVLCCEGGYVNDPDDKGGETYKGISRKYNPYWKGWEIVDTYKFNNPNVSNKERTKELDKDMKLQKEVYYLYKNNYWDCFELDDVPNQLVADTMFDTCVNQGFAAAIKFAERSLGLKETGKWKLDLFNKLVALK